MYPARKAVRTLAAAFAVVSIALIAAPTRLLLWPETDLPARADAVVVLAGGQGERLTKALELIHADTAPTLVITNGDDPKWAEANRLCRGASSFEVICFRPDPDNTRGEARALGSLAERRGWQSLVVVTSTYHVTRARLLLRRCYAGKTSFVGAPSSAGTFRTFLNLSREWAGLARSLIRGC
jgi:uncharacterized SAM-binding protein YcdF (DUF218 family)